MPGRKFQFAVSSLSCAPTNILQPQDIVLPTYATTKTIERLAHMRQALQHVIPLEEFTTSLHVGYMLNTPQARIVLKQYGISISSVDTPDIRTIMEAVGALTTDISTLDIKRIKTTLGWQFASVTTIEQYRQKVLEGINGINSDYSLHLIRTSAGSWYKSSVGKTLIEMIKKKRPMNPTLGVAIEIDALHQTPEEYFEFVYKLQESSLGVPIYFDLDVGHIAEARKRHRHHKIEKSEILVEKLLNNKKYSDRIGMISLNQYDHEKDETHISLMNGSIDYIKIMKLLGEAGRSGKLSVDPMIMAEFSPFEYDEMISPDGLEYFNSLKKAFYANN